MTITMNVLGHIKLFIALFAVSLCVYIILQVIVLGIFVRFVLFSTYQNDPARQSPTTRLFFAHFEHNME